MKSESMLYLDWNSTTPLAPEVRQAMLDAQDVGWANPASVHRAGRAARSLVEGAREACAQLMGVDPRDVTLTGGGTEANNLAIQSAFSDDPTGEVLVLSRLEHPSVIRAAERMGERGAKLAWVPLASDGTLDIEALTDLLGQLGERVRLICVQAVNHETGVIQPVQEVLAVAGGRPVHVDAVQAVGKLPMSAYLGATMVTMAGHKIRGPKGMGAVGTTPKWKLRPVLVGGAQERGARPGTQDPLAAAGLAVAARRALDGPSAWQSRSPLRDALEEALIELGGTTTGTPIVNGSARRAPHVSNLSWPGWNGPELCAALDLEGICVSSGSACSAGTADPSPIITAMEGIERARQAVRISIGDDFDAAALARTITLWKRVLSRSVAQS